MRFIVMSGRCQLGDCRCRALAGGDPEKLGYPPFHEDCFCYVVETSNDLLEENVG